jgi:hypothetical protein
MNHVRKDPGHCWDELGAQFLKTLDSVGWSLVHPLREMFALQRRGLEWVLVEEFHHLGAGAALEWERRTFLLLLHLM